MFHEHRHNAIPRHSLFALLVLAAVLLVVPARAASGDLDPTFGVGGKVTTDFASGSDFALGIAIQSDGKIVAAGSTSSATGLGIDFALARYNRDGSVDSSFGSGGEVTTDLGSRLDAASALGVQADGRIVAVGITAPAGRASDFALTRYDANGSLDGSFGSGGSVAIDFGGGDQGNAIAIQADGKIATAGGSSGDFALARLDADGGLDVSFGSGGMLKTDFGSDDFAHELALQADGKIVAVGRSAGDFILARYNLDGSLDASFGSSGKVTTDFGSGFDAAFGVAIQADGKIVAAGIGSGDFALARYNPDGSLDASFGNSGKVATDISGDDTANAIVVQADGRITTVGTTGAGDFTLVRYNPNGSLDASFGNGGKVTSDFDSAGDNAFDVAIQGDGRIVAAGGTFGASFSDFALARYESGGALIVSIDVRPRDSSNSTNLSSRGVVAVAVLTTAGFDATTVDPSTVCFGDADNASQRDCTEGHGRGHAQDVNGDGKPDLVLHYEVRETGIDAGDRTACLNATTFTGVSVEGCDSIEPH